MGPSENQRNDVNIFEYLNFNQKQKNWILAEKLSHNFRQCYPFICVIFQAASQQINTYILPKRLRMNILENINLDQKYRQNFQSLALAHLYRFI